MSSVGRGGVLEQHNHQPQLSLCIMQESGGSSVVCGTEEAFLVNNILFVVFKATECIIGLVLAIQTRKIKLKGLRESSQVALASYIFAFTLIVFVVAQYLTRQKPVFIVSLLVLGTLLLVSSLLILTAIFIPKVQEESTYSYSLFLACSMSMYAN